MRGQNFTFRVYGKVRQIPKGRVATYGQVAALLGAPRASRQVGWALNRLKPNTKVPWQRVLNREGRITIQNARATKDLQAALLRAEGVMVDFREDNYWVDLRRFQWHDQRQPAPRVEASRSSRPSSPSAS
ncbi:MAG: MGMT family protein [Candidatus Kerfeldbacteria bacterium]|nr:MGMT family protein [Candidatus Kerfeldbacteria bacterium]